MSKMSHYGTSTPQLFLGVFGAVFYIALDIVYALLETPHTFTEASHQFGNFLAAEKQQHYQAYDKEFTHAEISYE